MARIHSSATVQPSKLELLRAWLPRQPWAEGVDVATLESLGTFRFDDPAGEVGIETFLLTAAGGVLLQVPLTYRGAPLDEDAALVGVTEHSVLGTRWVYDGCADPAYVAAVADTIARGGSEAELVHDSGERRSSPVQVRGSGDGSADGRPGRVEVRRRLDRPAPGGALALAATWPGSSEPTVLVVLHRD